MACINKAVHNLLMLSPFSQYKRLLMTLKYHVFETIMKNEAFALLEQMLYFP